MNKRVLILSALALMFLSSCTSTKAVKTGAPIDNEKSTKSFLNEIKNIQQENNIEVTDESQKQSAEETASKAKNYKQSKNEVKPEASKESGALGKAHPSEENKKIITAAASSPSQIIENVTIESSPKKGIIIDETIVEDFDERYRPLAERDGYIETEESIIREEFKNEEIPDYIDQPTKEELEERRTLEELKDKELEELEKENEEARKELEELKKLKGVQDIKELEKIKEAQRKELLEKLANNKSAKYDVPIVINKKVEYFIKYFQSRKMRKIFNKWLSRSTKYLPMMKEIFAEMDMPQDLTYLAMIESGFNTSAYSRARAVGPWQFMRATGRKFDLRVDHWVDERRDPVKSTIAAASYLKYLHEMFDSWYLAAASYNAGEGKIGRAIKRYKTEDFWELSKYRYIKRETKNYIPKFIAAVLIAKDPDKYGFTSYKEQEPYDYDVVDIKEPTDLEVIAKSCGVRLSVIKSLNPELRRWYTPPERKVYKLKIPKNTKQKFLSNYSKLKPTEKISFMTYRIRYGETLSQVARRFGTSVSAIMRANKIRSARYVRAGVELTIPIRGGTKVASYKRSRRPKIARSKVILVPKGETVPYKVKRGDTLWDIAQRSGVRVTDIINLNNIKSSRIYPGKKILLYKEPQKIYAKKVTKKKVSNKDNGEYYTVRRGDSLWTISKKLNISIRELRRLNKLNRRSLIKPRQKLLIARKKNAVSDKNIKVASIDTKHKRYTVRKGDTLWEIAKKHKMAVSEIKRLNNLRSNRIKPGDTLKVRAITKKI